MIKKIPSYQSSSSRKSSIPAEWVTFAISLVIVLCVVGLVLFAWLTQDRQPPVISIVRSEPIREVQGQFYVPFKITNTGGGTAEAVQVIGELRINGQVAEGGEQQIDFLSGGETEEGAFVFTRNPQDGEIALRVASYKLP
jgi:uncharacterized protein (TIGR02588 family)